MQDINKMTVSQLKEMAKSLGIKKYEKFKKPELIETILNKINPEGKVDSVQKVVTSKKITTKKTTSKKSSKKIEDESKEDSNKPQKKSKKTSKEDDNGVKVSKSKDVITDFDALDSGVVASGMIEVLPDGYAFIRKDIFVQGPEDLYLSQALVKKYDLRTGDYIKGTIRIKTANTGQNDAIHAISEINGVPADISSTRPRFEELTPIFPNERMKLEKMGGKLSMRLVDLISPIGKGQRGMIVSPPKAGKTTLIKDIAKSITKNNPEILLIILLIDERPEEVTDIKESIEGKNVEVIFSTFDELPEHHKKAAEVTIGRAKRMVESGKDVVILLDSITRLSRAYNLTVTPSGRTLSGGLDPAALYGPKQFFGAARNMREGGSLTILATALVDTGSRMDDMIFEEFKGTGNMELVLDRKLSEKRVFPAIDVLKSGTRRDDLLLSPEEYDTMEMIRKGVSNLKPEEMSEKILDLFSKTNSNREFIGFAKNSFWQ